MSNTKRTDHIFSTSPRFKGGSDGYYRDNYFYRRSTSHSIKKTLNRTIIAPAARRGFSYARFAPLCGVLIPRRTNTRAHADPCCKSPHKPPQIPSKPQTNRGQLHAIPQNAVYFPMWSVFCPNSIICTRKSKRIHTGSQSFTAARGFSTASRAVDGYQRKIAPKSLYWRGIVAKVARVADKSRKIPHESRTG